MGLDMYLARKTYVKNWKTNKPEDDITVTVAGKGTEHIKTENISNIVEDVMYWRKANQIHNFFIEKCADGDGDRSTMRVEREHLEDLLDRCNKVLTASKLIEGKIKNGQRSTEKGWEDVMVDGKFIEDSTVAEELLPTASGFFFGGTDYDEYYIHDIVETKECLERLLKETEDTYKVDYEYTASW